MKEVKITMDLESGKWKVDVYEIGNTYQIYAEHNEDGNKIVHLMIQKNSYLRYLKSREGTNPINKYNGLSCTGKEFIGECDLEKMKQFLYEKMDEDLVEEKVAIGLMN